jgi:hypothetical protein
MDLSDKTGGPMSEIKLNLSDSVRTIHGTLHASIADALVAALSAEPETIEELEIALGRFIKPTSDASLLALFSNGEDSEPWDSGIGTIDLAARIVAWESTYSFPTADSEVAYHNGHEATDIQIPYRVPDDWLFVRSQEQYEFARVERIKNRLAEEPLDERLVLYGKAMTHFIASECAAAITRNEEDPITEIHAKWLMTRRGDLRDKSPRDVLLAKHDFIGFDMQWREFQWTMVGEGPPILPRDSRAYRYAGFGLHEHVVYYDLVRFLLIDCWENTVARGEVDVENETVRLERLGAEWIEQPQSDFGGKTPANIIEWERRRLPVAMSGAQAMVDPDCFTCEMMATDLGPYFWHLDGCNMDDGFTFSFHRTIEEFDEEERRRVEFNREFNEKYAKGEIDAWLAETDSSETVQ